MAKYKQHPDDANHAHKTHKRKANADAFKADLVSDAHQSLLSYYTSPCHCFQANYTHKAKKCQRQLKARMSRKSNRVGLSTTATTPTTTTTIAETPKKSKMELEAYDK